MVLRGVAAVTPKSYATATLREMNSDLGISEWPVQHACAAVRRRDGHTVTDGPLDHVFALASLTKPLVAYAMLVAVEEGSIALDDEPAEEGMPVGGTVRHLLAHASGLGPEAGDPITDPGRRRIYSNLGFEVLGRHLEATTGMTVAEYLTLGVTEPLGMLATTLAGSPAHAASSTVADWLRFVAELQSPTLLSPATLADAVDVQFPGLDGVLPGYGRQTPNDWGLGFERRGTKSPHWTASTNSPTTFGHFGRAGTMFWVDPVAGIACVAMADVDFGPWAVDAWPPLSERALSRV